ncbi:hypothetical protein [Sphingomonas sp.]|jgi:hypothetical protein|uniref:hypothetical protein n=1 Tax=Sphingomonas sp. TaxID=28214 RepID=UPI0026263ED8|nr:hypothetical protein [Sphingomonas sp.]MDF2603185.1 hypothetical protein [Sphingomonas sp.]
MLFSTPTQWLALAVALIAGWLFGLASHSGGRKWKQRYADERDVHSRNRKDFDSRLAERDARIKELERENARLASATPGAPVAPSAPVVTETTVREPVAPNRTVAQSAARPAGATRARWFDWNNRPTTSS